MTLRDYMEFVQLAYSEKVRVYVDKGLDGALFVGEMMGKGQGDILALDTLIDYLDNKVLEQFIGFEPGSLVVLIKPKR